MALKSDPQRETHHGTAVGADRVAELKAAYEAGELGVAAEWMGAVLARRDEEELARGD